MTEQERAWVRVKVETARACTAERSAWRWREEAGKLRTRFRAANKRKREWQARYRRLASGAEEARKIFGKEKIKLRGTLKWYAIAAWQVDGKGKRPIDADRGNRAAKILREKS